MSMNEMQGPVVSIVQRYKDRGNVFPMQHLDCENDPAKEQELRDFELLSQWKRNDSSQCPGEIANYLDTEMPDWRGQQHSFYLPKAQHIVEYYNRVRNFMAPTIESDWQSSREQFREYRSLCESKAHFCGDSLKNGDCPPRVLAYLNREAPNWLSIGQCKQYVRMDESFLKAEGIVERYLARGSKLPKEWRNHKNDPERTQEYKDAQKLSKWKESLKRLSEGRSGKGGHSCPPQLQDYLDSQLPEWRTEVREKNMPPLQRAQAIVARYRERGSALPRQLVDRTDCPVRLQEFKDAVRLKDWKRALRAGGGGGGGKCDAEVVTYMDMHMPGWRSRVYAKKKNGSMVYGENDDGKSGAGGTGLRDRNDEDDNIISITISSSSSSSSSSSINTYNDSSSHAGGESSSSSSSSSGDGDSAGSGDAGGGDAGGVVGAVVSTESDTVSSGGTVTTTTTTASTAATDSNSNELENSSSSNSNNNSANGGGNEATNNADTRSGSGKSSSGDGSSGGSGGHSAANGDGGVNAPPSSGTKRSSASQGNRGGDVVSKRTRSADSGAAGLTKTKTFTQTKGSQGGQSSRPPPSSSSSSSSKERSAAGLVTVRAGRM